MASVLRGADEMLVQIEIEHGRQLVEAAKEGNAQLVSELIQKKVKPNADAYNLSLYYKSKNYMTPLHWAAKNGFVDILKQLIDSGADLDALDMFAVTPVHLAAEGGHLDCLRLLLEAGASFNCGTAYKRPQWISNTVYPYVSDTQPLHLAAQKNHVECVRELILNGADYNAVDGQGRTSLYIAAEHGHEQTVLVHLRNAYGKTILSLPGATDETPLHHCIRHHMLEGVQELLLHGSDVNYKNKLGLSPLHLALQLVTASASFDIIRALVTKGYNTDINLLDGQLVSPLEYVCFKGYKQDRCPKIAAFLIAYGAKFMDLKTKHNLSLLQQELSRTVSDYIILRAMVKTVVKLPSLHALGIRVGYIGGDVNPFPVGREMHSFTPVEYVQKCSWYSQLASSPRTLQHHCRVVVRDRLGPKRLTKISSLPLPVPLQDYLLLEYDEYRNVSLDAPAESFREFQTPSQEPDSPKKPSVPGHSPTCLCGRCKRIKKLRIRMVTNDALELMRMEPDEETEEDIEMMIS